MRRNQRRAVDGSMVWTVLLSVAAHAALIAAILAVPKGPSLEPPPAIESYTVELVAPGEIAGDSGPQGAGANPMADPVEEPEPEVVEPAMEAEPEVAGEEAESEPEVAEEDPEPEVVEEEVEPEPEVAEEEVQPEPEVAEEEVQPEPEVEEDPEPAEEEVQPEPEVAEEEVQPEPEVEEDPEPEVAEEEVQPEPEVAEEEVEPEPEAIAEIAEPEFAEKQPAPEAEPKVAKAAPVVQPTAKPTRRKATKTPDPKAERDRRIATAVARRAKKPSADDQIAAAVQRRAKRVDTGGGAGLDGPLSSGPGNVAGGGVVLGAEYILYKRRMETKIRDQWVWAGSDDRLVSVVRFSVAPDGKVGAVRTTRSSGDRVYDQSAERAVRGASPLGMVPPRYQREFADVEMTFRASDLRR